MKKLMSAVLFLMMGIMVMNVGATTCLKAQVQTDFTNRSVIESVYDYNNSICAKDDIFIPISDIINS